MATALITAIPAEFKENIPNLLLDFYTVASLLRPWQNLRTILLASSFLHIYRRVGARP
jgi:hypothetical protein